MADFLRLLFDAFGFLWPFARIDAWEVGVYLVCGRVWKVVGPGVYFRIPWFMDLHHTSTAWEPITTRRHDVTTRDNRTLTFTATAWVKVADAVKAVTLVHDYEHGSAEIVASVLAEKLAEVDAERFEPEKRGRLNTSLKQWVERECADYGLEVGWLRFTTFVLTAQPQRILNDSVM